MARKQTLKSLLGGNDSRVEVDLNLDEQTFRAPQVRAGNYSVAAPVYSKTNALSQLSDSLERYSGPILKGYANIKEQQSLAMADATELLTPEQLKLLDAGDSSGLTESINNDKRKIDEAQRKKLITFAENPNNYERAYRRVGSRVAGVFTEDYLTNMDKYAEDESFDFQTKADEISEQYGLTGLGEQEFYKQINSISESTKARFGELKNAHMIREHKAETITDISQKFSDSTWSAPDWDDATGAGTVEQNQDILVGVVTNLREKNPAKADRIIELYEEGGIKIGNGAVNEEFLDQLQNARSNEDKRLDLIAQGVETKRNDSVSEFQAIYSNAIALGQDLPPSTELFINDGLTITVDTSKAKNAADVARAVSDAVAKIPEDDKSISEGTKALIVRQFSDEVVKEQMRVVTQRTNAGVNVASSEFMNFLAVKDSAGNPVYERMDTELDRANQTQEWLEELNPIIDAIYANPDIDPIDKPAQAMKARMIFVAEKKKDHDTFVSNKEESIKELRFEEQIGGDDTETYSSMIMAGYKLDLSDPEDPTVLERAPEALEKATEYEAETDVLANEILNREPTTEEANLTSEAFYQKKIKEGEQLRLTRKADLKADMADGKLDGRVGAEEDPATVLEDQKTASEKTEQPVVELQEISGLVPHALNGKKGFISGTPAYQALQNGAYNRMKMLKDLNSTSRGFGMGSYRDGATRHEAKGEDVVSWQDGKFDMVYVNINKSNKKVRLSDEKLAKQAIKYQEKAGEYLHGETLKRAAEDGTAPITLEELGSGSINGVKFSATEISQSAIVILPYDLVDKAFTDGDNLTTQEEVMLREYASSLYDTSNMNEAGTLEIIQKMVGYQVNAYTLVGFGFSKKDK